MKEAFASSSLAVRVRCRNLKELVKGWILRLQLRPLQNLNRVQKIVFKKNRSPLNFYNWRRALVSSSGRSDEDKLVGKVLPTREEFQDQSSISAHKDSLTTALLEAEKANKPAAEQAEAALSLHMQKPVDLYKAIFSDDSWRTKTIQASMKRFFESLGKELGLEVPKEAKDVHVYDSKPPEIELQVFVQAMCINSTRRNRLHPNLAGQKTQPQGGKTQRRLIERKNPESIGAVLGVDGAVQVQSPILLLLAVDITTVPGRRETGFDEKTWKTASTKAAKS
ncbi:hypothetical protein HPP92_003099 [Vanilla planifolia]|uniref:Uncharacterized protein n=1 Tax=Vanilla planifolia TaxID=51239 RepID=A0A835S6S3_VANPL|nr:hypothetical protein HPP92_003099 [Vanilla planifolia]